jgi:hypothetical protein
VCSCAGAASDGEDEADPDKLLELIQVRRSDDMLADLTCV